MKLFPPSCSSEPQAEPGMAHFQYFPYFDSKLLQHHTEPDILCVVYDLKESMISTDWNLNLN